jgi:hypothetical protein
MKRFIEGVDRGQGTLFPERLEDWIGEDNPVRVIDVFVDELDLGGLGFGRAVPEAKQSTLGRGTCPAPLRTAIRTPRSAAINAGDSKGVFENRPDHVINGSKQEISRAQRPTWGILRENQSDITWKPRSAAIASPETSHMRNVG